MFSFGDEQDQIYINPETKQIYGRPVLNIEKSETGKIELQIIKHSNGRSYPVAREHARAIKYQWVRNDSVLTFNPYFKLPRNQRWRNPYLKIKLKLPEGEQIYMDEDIMDMIYYLKSTAHIGKYNMAEKTWVMTQEGLSETSH